MAAIAQIGRNVDSINRVRATFPAQSGKSHDDPSEMLERIHHAYGLGEPAAEQEPIVYPLIVERPKLEPDVVIQSVRVDHIPEPPKSTPLLPAPKKQAGLPGDWGDVMAGKKLSGYCSG
jgi:hypothetical protein